MSTSGAAPGRRAPGLVDQVVAMLRTDIIRGLFAQGERLTEARLATHYGVSRVPVREALRLLEGEGFILTNDRGVRTVATLDPEDAEDVFSVRATVEGLTAARAATRATPTQIRVIRSLLGEGQQAFASDQIEVARQLNNDFHRAVALASGSATLLGLFDQLAGKVAWLFPDQDPGARAAWQAHTAIGEAIIARDVDAAQALMVAHIEQTRRTVTGCTAS